MHVHLSVNGDGKVLARGTSSARFGSAERRLGPWARWEWDGTCLIVQVDRYGFYPLFYASLKNGVAVADSIAELLELGASREFDDAGIAAFLRLGFFLGDDTPFAAIRALPPAGRLTWSAARGAVVAGAPIVRRPEAKLPRGAVAEEYAGRFAQAIARCFPLDPARTALPLSGGRDSRHIALALRRQGFRPHLVISQRHFPSRPDDDAEVAARLCQAIGWPLEVMPQAADPVGPELEKNRIFDCLTDEHAWFMPTARRIAAAGATAVFDGIAGDSLSRSVFMREDWVALGRERRLAEWLRRMPAWGYGAAESGLERVLAPAFRRRWTWEAAFTRVEEEFGKHAYDDNPLNQFMFWNRTRREIALAFLRYLPGVEVLTPYLDPEVFDFLWHLPTEYFLDQRLHDETIARVAPDCAGIPFAGGAPPRDPLSMNVAVMRGMARRRSFWQGGELLNRAWLRPRLAGALVWPRLARQAGWYLQAPPWLASLERLAAE